jgi:3-phenylpropionate/cinnamic acid dioxygenase small subunit
MATRALPPAELHSRLLQLNAEYARAIDDGDFEAWPEFFLEDGLYKLTTADNHAQGMEAGVIYADSRNMLRDRISALRVANIYEPLPPHRRLAPRARKRGGPRAL